MNNNDIELPENEKKAKKLSIIALGLFLVPNIILFILGFFDSHKILDSIFGVILIPLYGLLEIAGFITTIYINVKYPKNKFGKAVLILMCIAIALITIIAVFGILYLCTQCTKCY